MSTHVVKHEVCILIPLYNESESLEDLHQWIVKTFVEYPKYNFQVLFIDDGSTDNSWEKIKDIYKAHENVSGIRFSKNFGKATALYVGFQKIQTDFVATLDADLQDSPEELPKMLEMLQEQSLDIVSGWKKNRYDSVITKNIPSKIFNWAARCVSGIKIHDFNCGIKVYRKEVAQSVDLYGDMHRYIPVLASKKGYDKIGEKQVRHQARKYGKSKYGSDRFIKGFLDLLTIWFLNRFGKRPMHFFGVLGLLIIILGICFIAYLGIDKVFFDTTARLITQRPEFYISLTLIILGCQFFVAAFLSEILLGNRQVKTQLMIAEELEFSQKTS
ncbi:MAG: glycosyltransferase family 2 protein [Flavobacteriaceae bacterium]|nr:glycosyltransferase family 2 protein [Flavobacteriaceae bacterium]